MKRCVLCNEELLVYWAAEGQEVCDECFFEQLPPTKSVNDILD